MAYDPKDKADLKIVADAVAAALAEAELEHEEAIAGLKAKNVELITKNKALKKGEGDPEEVERLEKQIETLRGDAKTAEKTIKTLTRDRDTHKTAAELEGAAVKSLVVDNGLTAELVTVGVKKEFMPAVKKLLADKVELTTDGDKRTATVAGKPLSEFVKTWSQSDEGKHYVTAPANGGGNALGGKANGDGTQARVIARADYEANPASFAKDLAARTAVIGPAT